MKNFLSLAIGNMSHTRTYIPMKCLELKSVTCSKDHAPFVWNQPNVKKGISEAGQSFAADSCQQESKQTSFLVQDTEGSPLSVKVK